MDRIPGVVQGQVFSDTTRHEGSGVPRAELGDDDSDGVCG